MKRAHEHKDYYPKIDGDLTLAVGVEDNGNGEDELVIDFKEDKMTFTVYDSYEDTLYSMSYSYEDFMDFIEAREFQEVMLKHAAELHEAVGRHPAARLQLIDGGGKETK